MRFTQTLRQLGEITREGVAKVAGQRILIVDDNPQVRQELRTLLPLAGDLEVVGEAADGLEAIHLAEALRPDVILLDLQMPILDGYAAARRIKGRWPACRVVALTVYDDEATRQKASQANVDVFLVKGSPLGALVAAISGGENHS
jgi:DNA-binding NarL/FixJ family response regulator